jgi:hypothetical protein
MLQHEEGGEGKGVANEAHGDERDSQGSRDRMGISGLVALRPTPCKSNQARRETMQGEAAAAHQRGRERERKRERKREREKEKERERLTAFAGKRAAAERGFGPGGVGAPFGRHTSAHSPSLVGLGGRAPEELPAALVADEAGRFPRHQFGRSSLYLDKEAALSVMVAVGLVV